MIKIETYQTFTNLVLENKILRIECFPELGGKIHRIYSKKSEYNLLLPNQQEEYIKANFGDNFERYDTSGFDECFPSVSECEIRNEEGETIQIPDHGELWNGKWDYEICDEKLILIFKGNVFSYIFRKEISLSHNKLEIDYSVLNEDRTEMNYIWSAHPLLNVLPDDKIILPKEVKNCFVNWSSDYRIGNYCTNVKWPFIDGENNFEKVKEKSFGKAVKLFSERLKSGEAGFYFNKINQSLLVEFPSDKIPFLGLWICYGGWPGNGSKKHLTVALEPATGFPDSLAAAMQNKTAVKLEPNKSNQWKLTFSLVDGEININ